jgi:hypothetical protein
MPTRSATRLPRLAFLGVLLLICPPITTARAATELGLITGGEKGTYSQFDGHGPSPALNSSRGTGSTSMTSSPGSAG